MSMKEAFDVYFTKLNIYWQNNYGCFPKIPYNEKYQPMLKKDLFIPGTYQQDGYVQWQAKLQTENINFSNIEETLDITINSQIKDYFSTYWFMSLNGSFDKSFFRLPPVQPGIDIISTVVLYRKKGMVDYFDSGDYFSFGTAQIDGDERCGIYINNNSGEVICVQWDYRKSFHLADDLEKFICSMDIAI